MRSAIVPLVFAVVALAQNSFMINTPANAVVCQPLQLTWTGGTPPYFLSILPGGQPSAAALVDLGTQNGNSFTWTVNQAVGTSLGLNIRDSTGATAQSAPFNVNPGTDTSCVGQNPSTTNAGGSSAPAGTPPAGTSAPATTAATPATSGPATAPATTAPATTAPATSAAATTAPRPTTTVATSSRASGSSGSGASASTTSSPNAASANFAQAGAVGILGAALAAILA